MSYYSVADINFEIRNLGLCAQRMSKFQIEESERIDIQYDISYIADAFFCGDLSLIYDGKLFKEYGDGKYIYRVLSICIGRTESQLIIVRPKKKCSKWKILIGKEFEGLYPKYFDFANHLAFENVLCNFQGFILHASIVSYKEQGILFSAPSGTGKSTQAQLWEIYKHAEVLNGDRAFIRKKDEEFWTYGSPLAGSSGIYRNEKVKIKSIIILKQAKTNVIRKLSAREAFLHLYRETLINMWDKEFVTTIVGVLSELIAYIPVYELACLPDEGAVDLVYKTVVVDEENK